MFLEKLSKILKYLGLKLMPRQGLQLITAGIRDKFSPFELTPLTLVMLLQTASSVNHLKNEIIPNQTRNLGVK
jgi:hypothetical protein